MALKATGAFGAQLRRELRKILAKTILLRAFVGLLSLVALAGWVFLLAVGWVALSRELSLSHALVFSRVILALLALSFLAAIVWPLVRIPTLRRLAFELERRRDFQDLVEAGYEFSETDDALNRYSPELVREVIRQAVKSIQGLQVRFLFVSRRQLLFVPVAYAALAVLAVVAALSPALVLDTTRYIIAPRDIAWVAHEANLFCSPGDVTVLAGSDVEVVARDFGGSDQPVTLSYNLSNGFWKTEPVTPRQTRRSGDEHAYTFKDVRGHISYYVERGHSRTPTYTITVVHKPVVTELSLVLTPPAYTRETPDTLVDSGGNVSALEGTRVEISGRSNNELKDAWVEFDGGERKPVRAEGRSFEVEFAAIRDGTYSIVLRDTLGHQTEDPVVNTIDVFEDHAPVVDVLEPGDDALLPRNLLVALAFTAADDYGVQEAAVFHRKGGEEGFQETGIPLGPHAGEKELLVAYEWSLEGVTLFPGEFVEYYVEVKDNNVVTGPGVGRSPVMRISVPTMAELYEQVEDQSEKRADIIGEALKEGTDLKERVDKLAMEMKKTDGMDWSQQKEIDKAIASQENIQDMLEQVQKSLDETLESLSENRMTSQQIGEKLEEINRLIEEIDSEALNKYIEEMREAMAKLDPEKVQQALQNLDMSAEDLLKSLERTEALLKQIQREQEMEELVRKTRDLMESQEKLSDRTAEAGDQPSMDELSREQEELAKQAAELERDLKQRSQETEDRELSQRLEKASESNSMSTTSNEMREASGRLQKGQKSRAMSHQEQAMENLVGLFNDLSSIQAEMQAASNNRLAANLQRLASSTLDVSFKQESLADRLREHIPAENLSDPAVVRELAEEQQRYVRAVEQLADELYELSKQSVMVPDNIVETLGRCAESMEGSLLFLEQNKAFMSTTSASRATTALNEATIQLLRACKNCSGGPVSGSAQGEPMLQQLLAGQQQVLRETEQLVAMRAAQEKLLQELQADVKRVAGEQRSLKEIAEKIQKDFKENERMLGRMDRTVEEMEEVIRDLESGALSDETLRKEERILSRLLDAQRSIHTRDYENKRVSQTARDVFSEGPGQPSVRSASQMLREEIRRAMTLKAPGEFEDLIRLYFRALAEETPAKPGTE